MNIFQAMVDKDIKAQSIIENPKVLNQKIAPKKKPEPKKSETRPKFRGGKKRGKQAQPIEQQFQEKEP